MNILVYGAGVIGSIFAGKLALAGNNVSVLARGKRLEEIKNDGVILVNPKTKKNEKASVKVIDMLLPDDKYDYIIVAMQRTQVDHILPALSQNCSKNIVFVVNTAGGYDRWVYAIGENRLMIGFPSAGGERKDGKVYYFVGKGIQRTFQTTTFGEYSGEKTERVKILIKLFNQAKIPSVFCNDMDAWQRTHVAIVSNIANALYSFNCDNFKLGHSYKGVKDMVLGIKEGQKVLKNSGIKVTPQKLWWIELPTPILTFLFAIFMRTTLAETTMAKHCIVAKSEMIYLQEEFDELIRKSGVETPIIDKLKKNLYMKNEHS
ncbi:MULTISPECIES: ketopantoate reductase family protein [unclassified Sedimentibacter]|uniref:ketopantoate reductase family protein n=1 Tax=unclassified Sedimentibacter TaxID=2649220 RepID=UPI0027DEBDD5|nr:2-dehydropantoate 2-reductase N-terminal domain-containing protein [Sedimentibacter sp. MB35-C1]WMJ77530.1 2-dehydropantoate 2-reductase N-terminal domain-containing protein [Sedimentibacter sp. MB35-C1]